MYFLLDTCENPAILRLFFFGLLIRDVIFTVVPIGLIIMLLVDFSKSVVSAGSIELKGTNIVIKRIIYALIIFLTPWIVDALMSILDGAGLSVGTNYKLCVSNAKDGNFDYYDNLKEEEDRKAEQDRLDKIEEFREQYEPVIAKTIDAVHRVLGIQKTGEMYTGNAANAMAKKMLEVAYAELGENNDTTGRYGTAGAAWCGMYATWVMQNTGLNGVNLYDDIIQKENNVSNRAEAGGTMYTFENSSNLNFYYSKFYASNIKKDRAADGDYIPKPGDIIYFWYPSRAGNKYWYGEITESPSSKIHHVGIVTYTENGYVHTIEGNTSDPSGKYSGFVVAELSYKIDDDRIIGYGSWYSDDGTGSSGDDSIKNTSEVQAMKKEIASYINRKDYDISIGYYNINKDYTYTLNKDRVYYGASTIKTLDVLYYYNHKSKLNSQAKERIRKAITVSDDDAHINSINDIGINQYREYGKSLGVSSSIMDTVTPNGGKFGDTDVNTQFIYLKELYSLINNDSDGNTLKSYFANDTYNCLKYKGSPTTMHKYGSYPDYNVFHDVGIVLDGQNPYIVVILTRGGDCNVVTELSKKIYKLHKEVQKGGNNGQVQEIS